MATDNNTDVEQQKRSLFGFGLRRAIFGALAIGAIIGGFIVIGSSGLALFGGIALFAVAAACLVGVIKSRTDEGAGYIHLAATERAQTGQSPDLQPHHQLDLMLDTGKSQQPQFSRAPQTVQPPQQAPQPPQPSQLSQPPAPVAPPSSVPSPPQTASATPSADLLDASATPAVSQENSIGA